MSKRSPLSAAAADPSRSCTFETECALLAVICGNAGRRYAYNANIEIIPIQSDHSGRSEHQPPSARASSVAAREGLRSALSRKGETGGKGTGHTQRRHPRNATGHGASRARLSHSTSARRASKRPDKQEFWEGGKSR